MIFASDSRTYSPPNDIAKTCKMALFERRGDRVVVVLSSGNRAAAAAVICALNRGCQGSDASKDLLNAPDLPAVVEMVISTMRTVEQGDDGSLRKDELSFNPTFIVGGQIGSGPLRLFQIYPEGRFVEAGVDRPYFQTGETKYGKPIVDRVIARHTSLADAAKCVLVSFDSTMRSSYSVGMPIDLVCYERDSLQVRMRRRFDDGDPYFRTLSHEWIRSTRQVCHQLPELCW